MTATIEKTRPDGTKVKISASLTIEFFGISPVKWSIDVQICRPKKRTWFGVYSSDDYHYRRLNMADRDAYVLEKQLAVCTLDEMLEAKIKLWESLKPTL